MAKPATPKLARSMGLAALLFYGVGDILGAGIYGLLGKWAGVMGNAIWIAFLASMVGAVLTGLSYASLGSRYPRAGGAAYVTERAFGFPFLSYAVGLAVVASGLTSMAAQAHAFSGYFAGLAGLLPPGTGAAPGAEQVMREAGAVTWAIFIVSFVAVLTFINLWGIRQSSRFNIVATSIEVTGLLIVVAVGLRFWGSVDYFEVPRAADVDAEAATALSLSLILQGAALTFYAFLGFEDLINVSEEVKNPRRNFPLALCLALAIAAVVYIPVSITAVSVMPHQQLSQSGQPLVDVVRGAAPWFPTRVYSIIALFAIANTALLNYVMGSRVVYGMAGQALVPRFLGQLHPQRRTPHYAILALMVIVLALALSGDIKDLAAATSLLLLLVFVAVNAALLVLKRRSAEPRGAFEIPAAVPIGGIIACLAMLSRAGWAAWKIAGVLAAGIALLYFVLRPRRT
jgi:basic amino acid/polyamine antiporter, APA family